MLIGLSAGSAALLITLSASASYIAVPAALRLALPEATPSIYLTLSLGITFPVQPGDWHSTLYLACGGFDMTLKTHKKKRIEIMIEAAALHRIIEVLDRVWCHRIYGAAGAGRAAACPVTGNAMMFLVTPRAS